MCLDCCCPHQRCGSSKTRVAQKRTAPSSDAKKAGTMQLDAVGAAHPGTVFDDKRKVWQASTNEAASEEAEP